ncbi:CAP domain-containing protein [Deinococcus sp.]|uniref:CAP domain-containing protein n=1 Tax=Deinococcus sp. TaxID=47478 RepID=UPI0028699FDB|nr:CAP domain-containing protein [Deinococcus sp.]
MKHSLTVIVSTLALALAACGQLATPTTSTTAPDATLATMNGQATAGTTTLSVGQTRQFNVTIGGQPAQPGQLKWTTTNAGIATVTQTGLVTAKAAGSARVRAALATNAGAYIDFPVVVQAAAPAPTPSPAPSPGPTPPPTGTTPSGTFAQRVLDLTNAARAQARTCGTTSYAATTLLTYNAALGQAAQGHATDMATKNYFSHTSQDGRTFDQRITAAGYAWTRIAENIAAGQTTPESVVAGWLTSAGHCANIMNPALKELGVGYAYNAGSTYGHYWVQDFGTR